MNETERWSGNVSSEWPGLEERLENGAHSVSTEVSLPVC